MKTIKEKADGLVFKFFDYTDNETYADIECAILSVKHTIEVLKQENDISYTTLDYVINEQEQLLKELESRI